LLAGIVAWLSGLIVYLRTGWAFWSQLNSGRLSALWFALLVLLTVVVILGPPMFLLRTRIFAASTHPGGVFVALGGLLGMVPIMLFFAVQVGITNLGLPEVAMFYLFFGALGGMFGAVFYFVSAWRSA
jgi:hypothetical protein